MSQDVSTIPLAMPASFASKRRLHAELSKPILIEDVVSHGFVVRVTLLIAAGILALLAWAGVARVHEVSRAGGSVVPAGFERTVQHFDGGMVREIFVHSGDIVRAGAPLFRLEDQATAQDVGILDKQRVNLLAQIEVLKALAENRSPDFSVLGAGHGALVEANLANFLVKRDAQEARRQLLASRTDQAKFSIGALEQQIKGGTQQLQYARQDEARAKQLHKKQLLSTAALAERTSLVKKIESEVEVLNKRLAVARGDLAETRQSLASYNMETRSDLLGRVQQLQSNVAAFEGEVAKKSNRQKRLTVTSPIYGVVKALDVNTIGAVITPGQTLATIVPLDETLVAETQLPADQIGYVHVGMPAQVKVSAYDFTRFGWIDGHVQSISPSAFRAEDGSAFFRVRVQLASTSPNHAPQARILPGMEVSVDIITGDKTILAYLFNPIRKAFSNAFGER